MSDRASHYQPRELRDLLALLLLLVAGFGCLLAAAQAAVWPKRTWKVEASMLSQIDPDAGYSEWNIYFEPLRREAIDLQPFNPDTLRTPGAEAVIAPPVTFSTPTATPTPPPSPTPPAVAPTSPPAQPTAVRTPTPTPTPTSTFTPRPTHTPTAPPGPPVTPPAPPSATPPPGPPRPPRPSPTPTPLPTRPPRP